MNGLLASEVGFEALGSLDTHIPLALGALDRSIFGPTSGFFTGQMDEVAIYDRALNQGETTSLATVPVLEPSTLLLLGTGLVGLAAYRRKRRV